LSVQRKYHPTLSEIVLHKSSLPFEMPSHFMLLNRK